MDFHGINMQGYFKSDTVSDASVLSWTPSVSANIVYDETTEDLWLADDTEWKIAGQYVDTPVGTEMWFYQVSAPTGWDPVIIPGDKLLAVKGGAYVTGGTEDGEWDTPSHSHTLAGHGHAFSGSTSGYSGPIYNGRSQGEGNELTIWTHQHSISGTLSSPTPNSTLTNGQKSNYRPYSSVGLICKRAE